ncbi:putative adhesin, partial [Enterobacter asburiae]
GSGIAALAGQGRQSSALGWLSLGLGIPGAVAGIGGLVQVRIKWIRSIALPMDTTATLNDSEIGCFSGDEIDARNKGSYSTTNIGSATITHSSEHSNRLLINAHGLNVFFGGKVIIPKGMTLNHYAEFGGTVEALDRNGGLRSVLNGAKPTSIKPAGSTTSNTRLGFFSLDYIEGNYVTRTHQEVIDSIVKAGSDLLNINEGYYPNLKTIFSQLEQNNLHYDIIDAVFCRQSEARLFFSIKGPKRVLL